MVLYNPGDSDKVLRQRKFLYRDIFWGGSDILSGWNVCFSYYGNKEGYVNNEKSGVGEDFESQHWDHQDVSTGCTSCTALRVVNTAVFKCHLKITLFKESYI